MSIAIIPARGGSRRIPRKNIRPFAGRPMICWSIDAARASGCFERIVVSTDDDEIAEVARSAGAEVPFRRPPELADDLDVATLRGIALRNRLDVYRRLLEFGAADAEVKLAVAAQNPGITLGPGYSWDQGDNIWSLAIGVSLPGAALSRAVIREAHARRELAAEQFSAKQIDAISLCERAGAQLRQARSRVAAAQRQVQDQQDQEARILRQFKAGAADRLERVSARSEVLAAQAVLQNAQIEVQEAMAQLEEALQRPLLDDGQGLPAGVSGIPGSEMTKP